VADDFDDIREQIAEAQRVLVTATSTRIRLRRKLKRDHSGRQEAIAAILEAIDAAMKPIRSISGRMNWQAFPEDLCEAVPEVSSSLQYERRQLKKMR